MPSKARQASKQDDKQTNQHQQNVKRRTRPIEVPPRRHIIHNPTDRKQDTLAILAIEGLERLRRVRLEEQRRRVRLGHPRVAALELVRHRLRERVRGEEDALHGVEDVQQQRGVHGGPEVEGHRRER